MKIYKPEVFQGKISNKHYFEGWYFKCVDASGKEAVSIIPGISLSGDKSHSFIQFFDRSAGGAKYFRYDTKMFSSLSNRFDTRVGGSYFSQDKLHLDIDSEGCRITGALSFKNKHPWPVTLLSPGVMGWYRFVPGMECYHGVLSFNHMIEGFIEVNGKRRDFSGGKGYCEKDWGTSMPASWVWMQCNHFEEQEASVFLSVARIPWMGGWFPGFIAGVYHKGRIYRFATYTGAKLRALDVTDENVNLIIEGSGLMLEIECFRAEGAELPAPVFGEMKAMIKEALSSSVKVSMKNKSGQVIFQGSGINAGLEVVGNTSELRP